MAIIKCPECGHQISDKAPVCPSCGVEIAGKVIKCPNCGEVYFKVQEMCPNCHRPTYQAQVPPVTDPKPVLHLYLLYHRQLLRHQLHRFLLLHQQLQLLRQLLALQHRDPSKMQRERNSQNRRSQVWSSSYQPSSLS